MIMLFIVDLVMIIKKKYKQEKRTHNIKIYGKKVHLYKEVIEAKMNVINGAKLAENDAEHPNGHGQNDVQAEGGCIESVSKKFTDTFMKSKEEKADIDMSKGEDMLKLEADKKICEKLIEQVKPDWNYEILNKATEKMERMNMDDKDDHWDLQEGELLELEERYGDKYKKFNIKYQNDIFDDLVVTKKLYAERTRYKFMKIAELIKKRISFFGIYSLNDQVDMTEEKLGHMRKQLQVTFRLLLEHQNKLLTNFKIERGENEKNIDQKFEEVGNKLRKGKDKN